MKTKDIAKNILGHVPESPSPNSSSASLCDLCAFAVKNSANFAWDHYMLRNLPGHSVTTPGLAPNGSMALMLANGSMSSNSSAEGDIRRANILQSRTLATLRDTLLPKLLSREVVIGKFSKEVFDHV